MTKLEQFSSKFDVLYLREIFHGLGESSASGAVAQDLGQERVLHSIRRGNVEIGHDGLGGGGFPYKASRPIFYGQVS